MLFSSYSFDYVTMLLKKLTVDSQYPLNEDRLFTVARKPSTV